MKKLTITIRAELDVPDSWQLVEHPSGIEVLRVGDQYVDFDLTPLATRSSDPDAEWSDSNQDLVSEVLDAVTGMEAEFELHSEH